METGRRFYDNATEGECMNQQYISVCRDEFTIIKEKVGNIEQKIFNGFDDKITNASNGVDKLEKSVEGLRKLIISMLLSIIGGSFGIIITLVMR